MSEEGLFYYFEHEGAPGTPAWAATGWSSPTTMARSSPGIQPFVRFTQPGAVMQEDSIDRWRCELKLRTNAIELSSWDYRTLDRRPVSSSSTQADIGLVIRDFCGPYAYPGRSHGQRLADRQLQALEARREVFTGAGTVRTLAPGTSFTLSGHAVHDMEDEDARTFLVTRAQHLMHNNLSAEMKARIAEHLGAAGRATAVPQPYRRHPQQHSISCRLHAASTPDRPWPADRGRGRPGRRGGAHRPRSPDQGAVPLAARRGQPQPPVASKPRRTRGRARRRSAPAPGSASPRRWRPSPAPTGAAMRCRGSGRKCWSTSWKVTSTAP
jgi:uncharacterized protein involved in type VI secretion and phage assembly